MNRLRGIALAVVVSGMVAACGGGGGSIGAVTAGAGGSGGIGTTGSSSGGNTTAPTTGSNVLPIAVNYGVLGPSDPYMNGAFASVTVCIPGTSTCQTIDDILIDTGSYGLRLIGSALNIALPIQTNTAGDSIGECGMFADSYTWGPVAAADIELAGEFAGNVPIQIIGAANFPATPSGCSGNATGQEEDTVEKFGANGLLGVGVFAQDCGEACVTNAGNPGFYFACDSSNSECSVTIESLATQVQNPVPLFAADNNGVIVELPPISPTGASSVSGSLIFGIGTESNNGLGSAQVLTLDGVGNFTTQFNGSSIPGFLDSGSNALFFNDNSITQCTGDFGDFAGFYCPSSTENFSAQMVGANGLSITVPFSVANTETLAGENSGDDVAFNDLAGTTGTGLDGFFDWGLSFFYGNNVYFAIQGQSAPGGTTPYNAFVAN